MPRKNPDLIPLYIATKSLDVKYEFASPKTENVTVEVPAAGIHASLYASCVDMLGIRSAMRNKGGKKDEKEKRRLTKLYQKKSIFLPLLSLSCLRTPHQMKVI